MPNFRVLGCVGPAAGRRTYIHTHIHTHFHLYIVDEHIFIGDYIFQLMGRGPDGAHGQNAMLSAEVGKRIGTENVLNLNTEVGTAKEKNKKSKIAQLGRLVQVCNLRLNFNPLNYRILVGQPGLTRVCQPAHLLV